MMTRRVFLGMAGVAGAGLWLGVPGLAQAAVSRETKVMLGTFVDVSVAGVSSMQASDALGLAFAEASRLERVFSRHDGGTPVSELNRAGRLRAAPAELVRVVNRSLFYGALTGGSFDVTVQPVIDLFRAHRNPSGELTLDDSELRAARALVGRRGLQVSGADLSFARSGMGITLDGILGWGMTPSALIGTILLDYIVAYTVIGIAGVFRKKGYVGICCGTALAVALRFVCHFISGAIIFANFDEFVAFGASWVGHPWLYSFCYNGTYMLPELIFTVIAAVILFRLPQMKKLIADEGE